MHMEENTQKKSPWAWVPSLYFAQGIPYVMVMTVSVIMYKRMGVSNADIALYTSWLYLPWVIKPLWSPIVDMFKTKRWWVVIMQLMVGAGLAGVAFTIPLPSFFQYTLAFFWLMAFSSATHDIAADGFYMLGLSQGDQSYFIGIRSTFYRFAMITGQGLLIIVAGYFEVFTGQEPVRFSVTAHPEGAVVEMVDAIPSEEETQEMTFVLGTDDLYLSLDGVDTDKADSIRRWAHRHNVAHGFVIEEEVAEVARASWWSRAVSQPLANWIRARLGIEDHLVAEPLDTQGNIGLIGVRLSVPPPADDPIVLNTGFQRGDASIRLVEGERLEFTSENWDQTAWLLVQLDPKLDRESIAWFEGRSGNIPLAWSITFFILTGLFILFFVYHLFMLPRPSSDQPVVKSQDRHFMVEFLQTFGSFFRKKQIWPALAFLLLFRLGEAQIVKMASPFLLDRRELGGLGMPTGDVGWVYGTFGILALTLGGILGGLMASKKGLKFWILPMTLAINLPNLVYVYLAYATPESFWLISGAVAVEQFGYGFGFTAYMLYMIYFSQGKQKTAHFAICTGLMALGMMVPGMISGWIQEIVGYSNFFIWVLLCAIPGLLVLRYLKIDKDFGIKK